MINHTVSYYFIYKQFVIHLLSHSNLQNKFFILERR